MKIPPPFTIYDLRFTIGKSAASNRKSPIVNRKSSGIALVITLIMLAVTLVMAVAFLALARRERGKLSTTTDTTMARLAADTSIANAEAQIVANMLNTFTNGNSGNAYNLRLLVSTNYINPLGFDTAGGPFGFGSGNPTNVNYFDVNGKMLAPANFAQNVANLWFLPRAPVFVVTNNITGSNDFRFYLDLNQNGRFDANGWITNVDTLNNPIFDSSGNDMVFAQGDPEWIGVLEHPDAPHGPNNHFVSRYAFIALPVGNSLDLNGIHNQTMTRLVNPAAGISDGFFRNQGVGSWELNLAAFLADLNTNIWNNTAAPYFYGRALSTPFPNTGAAFDDARALLSYRYNFDYRSLASANTVFSAALNPFPFDGIDGYSDGPLQTTLNTNADLGALSTDGDLRPNQPWAGANNTNFYFTPGDFFDTSKVQRGIAFGFADRLRNAGIIPPPGGTTVPTYDRYTYYRMLDQLGTDSTLEQGKLNLNYSNAVVSGTVINGAFVVTNVSVVAAAETNLMPWTPQDFFLAAADQLLRTYSTSWFKSNPTNYLATYYGVYLNTNAFIDGTGMGVTNVQYRGQTNELPTFGVGNIPVLFNGSFVYTPAVNRLLQLAANIYDATTNYNNNLPHVFRPIFERDNFNNVFIVGYTNVIGVNGATDPQLNAPHPISDLANFGAFNAPFNDGSGSINVYGVPWIIGAKKGLPGFNQLYLLNEAQITRKLQVSRTTTDPATATYFTNQMYDMGISNSLGISFWNSYTTTYPRPVKIFVTDLLNIYLTNSILPVGFTNLTLGYPADGHAGGFVVNSWPGSQWNSGPPTAALKNTGSFFGASWSFSYLNDSVCRFTAGSGMGFDPSPNPAWDPSPLLPHLPQIGLMITNYLQAFILDGNNVIDYVQLRDPISNGNLNQALADPDFPDPYMPNTYWQWSTNNYVTSNPLSAYWGVMNQLNVSLHPNLAPASSWVRPPGMPGSLSSATPGAAEAAFFGGLWNPTFQFEGKNYTVTQLTIQAPYTPTRTVFSSFLLQANDPLIHYMASDLNSQYGAEAVWANKAQWQNGVWNKINDSHQQPIPQPPSNPVGGRYQPWMQKGQMDGIAHVFGVTNNYAVKDPLARFSDDWNFPTNAYPTVGWLGRVHRGTPWQTVYLKDADLPRPFLNPDRSTNFVGINTWANWTGDLLPYSTAPYAQFYDAANASPVQDRLLFDIFTTRFNDNAVRGTLPVNQTHLASWSALFAGMVALTNNSPTALFNTVFTNTYRIIDPAGLDAVNSPLWQLVNGTNGINAARANTNIFPFQSFTHVGDILATPALTKFSPFLNLGSTQIGYQQMNYGIRDELYEWLPQQMMGLVRLGEPRFVLYCYGQALRPAPGGEVLGGPFYQLITNYQVVAESAVRAVIRVENANTSKPHAVVESYNVLLPN